VVIINIKVLQNSNSCCFDMMRNTVATHTTMRLESARDENLMNIFHEFLGVYFIFNNFPFVTLYCTYKCISVITNTLIKLLRQEREFVSVVGLFTGHCHLKRHLFKLGLTGDHTFEWCRGKDEWATHVLCDCEATACLRFRHLGQFSMEPSDYYDAPMNKALYIIRSVGSIKGEAQQII
jgi:hypothetical protein